MKTSDFKKLSLLEQATTYIKECEITLKVENLDPQILSDIGTEGLVFDGYVLYMAKGEYEFELPSIVGKRKRMAPGYHIWTEVSIPGTRDSPPDGDVVELLTTQSLHEAMAKVLEVVIHERMSVLADRFADSDAAEAEEEYEKLLKENQ